MNEVQERFLLPQSGDLTIDDISNFDVKTLNRKIVLDIVRSSLILLDGSNDGCVDETVVLVQTLREFLFAVPDYFVPDVHSFVDKIVHILLL